MKKEKETTQEPKKEPKYFWFKLHDDFFADSKIKLLEKMPNGEKYGWFLFKLICKSIKTEGLLRFSDKLPYSPKMLADITDTDIDVVRSALSAFDVCELIDVFEDGTYFIDLVPSNTGKESESAERVRRCRERKKGGLLTQSKALQCNNNVTALHCNVEKEKDKEIKLDIEYNSSAHTCEAKPISKKNKNFDALVYPNGEKFDVDSKEEYFDGEFITEKDKQLTNFGKKWPNVLMSNLQFSSLCDFLSLDELHAYLDKMDGMLEKGYKFNCSHYEQILKMVEQDRRVRKNE